MDVLSDILDTMRLRGTIYFATELTRPWGIRVPSHRRVARFHLVVRGVCTVWVTGREAPVSLDAGDIIVIPHGAEHVLACSTESPVVSLDDVVRASGYTGRGTLVYGGQDAGAPTRMLCGHFEFDEGMDHPFMAQLPSALVVPREPELHGSPIEEAFRFITREAQLERPGHEAVMRRLSEVLFFQAVRLWADRADAATGALAALRDPHIARALTAIHEDPAAPWTLDSLGRHAAMGRSAFAARFRDVVGVTPLRYVSMWRVQLAKRMLGDSRFTLERIAKEVGYESAASLSRVFRKVTASSPGAWRRDRAVAR